MDDSTELMVRSMTWESEGVLSLVLADPDDAPLPAWQPGAHIDLRGPDGPERQYSLCGDPGNRRSWTVAVLREPSSRGGSAWVHTALRPGDRVTAGGPRNNFPLKDHRRYLFIAGGIGITPLLPMIEEVDRRGGDWRLVYGGRRRASMAFTERLARHGDRVMLWPEDEHGRIDLAGELSPRDDTVVYCCGPEALLAAVEQQCAGWPAGSLRVERFRPRPATTAPDEERAFEVVLAGQGRTVPVPVGVSIIDALEQAGFHPPCSCLEGTCGTCETTVLDGVPDHRDSILDDEERTANKTMMICVSRARSARLVLDL